MPGKKKAGTKAASQKREKKQSLSNEERMEICEMYLEQEQPTRIAQKYSVSKSTISRIISRFLETDSHKSKPKGGRWDHKKLTEEQMERLTEFYVSKEETPTLSVLREFCERDLDIRISLGTAFNTVRKIKSRLKEEEAPKETVQVDDEGEFELYIVTDD